MAMRRRHDDGARVLGSWMRMREREVGGQFRGPLLPLFFCLFGGFVAVVGKNETKASGHIATTSCKK